MSTKEEKLATALDTINGNIHIYKDRFKKIYPFTTENIGGYINKFKLAGTKLLTVGSSADQAINASLNGCRDITVLDICPYAKEYFYLKNATIQAMPQEVFEKFLLYRGFHLGIFDNARVLSKETFQQLSETLGDLDADSLWFWENLLSQKSPSTIRRKLFSADEHNPYVIRRVNPYLESQDSYDKTRTSLQDTKITFLEGDITTYPLQENYDNIFLSNIPCNYSLEATVALVNRLLPHLNENGEILISYLYDLTPSLDYCEGESEIYDIHRAKKILPSPTKLTRLPSITGPFYADGVLVYKKQK